MHLTRIDIPLPQREQLIRLLNERLTDLVDLQRQAKQAHWSVRGPNFIALHRLFDEIAEGLDAHIDDVAARVASLGGIAEATIQIVAKRTTLAEYPLEMTARHDHLDALATAVATVGRGARVAVNDASELSDANTADLFTGLSRGLDQTLWSLESHLEPGH